MARHLVYNNCAFLFPLHGVRRAHLEMSGCSPVLLAGGPKAAESLPQSREQKLCDRMEQRGAALQLRKEVIS